MGLAGASVMGAVALGAPTGTLLLSWSPAAPALFGAALQLLVAAHLVHRPVKAPPKRAGSSPFRLLKQIPAVRLPTLWVTAERFAVGCLVVSFALYAHRVLGLSDASVGALFSWFLLPFAVCTYPASRIAEHVPRAALASTGMALYGLAFLLLGVVPEQGLAAVMLLAGLSSAAIYAPSLCYAAALPPPEARSMSRALLNAGGSLGMTIGTALAGILSVSLRRAGWTDGHIFPAIFAIAGGAQLLVLGASVPGLRGLHRSDRRTSSTEGARA